MPEGRIAQLWATAAAIALGVLIAFAASHRLPPWWLLAALVVAPLLFTVVRTRRLHYVSGGRVNGGRPAPAGRRASRPVFVRAPGESRSESAQTSLQPPSEADMLVADRVLGSLNERQLRWLRTNEYLSPWFDQKVQPVMALHGLLRNLDASPGSGPDDALGSLVEAVERFVVFYDANTSPDPMLVGDDWRFFDWETLSAGVEPLGQSDSLGKPGLLRDLSVEVADAYEAYVAAMTPVSPGRPG